MRIIIELDIARGTLQSISADEQPADAGGPADHLLAELDAGSRLADAGEAIDGGAPPAWLIEAVALAAASDAKSWGSAVAGDGGRAPDAE